MKHELSAKLYITAVVNQRFTLTAFGLMILCLTILMTAQIAQAQTRAYIPHQGTLDVKIVDLATNTIVGTIPLGVVPEEIAFSPDRTRGYVSTWNNDVKVINTASNTVIATIPVGPARGVAVAPDGSKVYVTNHHSNTLSVINTATNTVSATVTIGWNPLGVTFTRQRYQSLRQQPFKQQRVRVR